MSHPVRPGIGRHNCHQCGRTYSRRDHLVRHLQSHTSRRQFVCSKCGKDFARGDLLLRHSAIHDFQGSNLASGSPSSPPNVARRVSRACKPCAEAKVKCHDQKPCRRCLRRGFECIPISPTHTPDNHSNEISGDSIRIETVRQGESDTGLCGPFTTSEPRTPRTDPPPFQNICDSPMVEGMPDISVFPNDPFYGILQSYDTQSTFYNSSHTLDMEPALRMSHEAVTLEPFTFGGAWDGLPESGRIKRATEVFKDSLWYSTPDRRWSGGDAMGRDLVSPTVDGESEAFARQMWPSIPQRFNNSTRDNLLVSLVLSANERAPECLGSLRTIFPSSHLLNALVHSFFERHDQKIDTWIHSASFRLNEQNGELTAMIVASSALNTSITALRRLGTNLRRLLRPVILSKLESEHEADHRLQLYQTLLLSLELDLWQDEDDCLHRAGKFSSTIARFLRQELGRGAPELAASPLETDEAADDTEKWTSWVTAESYKRLIMRFCVYDNQLSMTLGCRALINHSEYQLHAPQPKDLWLAKSSTEWKLIYLSQQPHFIPRVTDLLASMPRISGFLDRALATKVIFHWIGGLIAEYHLSAQALHCRSQESGNGVVPENTRRRKTELEAAIRHFDHNIRRHICGPNIGGLIVSYLSMTLNVSIGNIEVLAGKAGEQDSREMYALMKNWPDTPEAREAIWHAGQILRLFKLLDRLTSFQIVMAYHAGMVIFAYSVLSCIQGRLPQAQNGRVWCLNDTPCSRAEEEFMRNGSLEPMLRSDFRGTERVAVSLFATKDAVQIVSEIILNCSFKYEELSPRLINGLVGLLQDLASAMQPPFLPDLGLA